MNQIKRLFETPKKAFLSVVCIAALLFIIGIVAIFFTNIIARKTSIGEENARILACNDAGIDPALAETYHTEFDFEQGTFVYDVEFTSGGVSYEYRLKASDGTILKKETDDSYGSLKQENKVDTTISQPSDEELNSTEVLQQNNAQITLDDAKSAALTDAQVSPSDATFIKEKLDYEDGIAVYEIEFYTSDFKYEYEINAATGDVYKKDVEAFSPNTIQNGNTNDSSAQISVEDAKAAAINHAGFSDADVTFTKTELERKHGQMVYEIEFFKDGMEYEYKIHASTGDILEYEIDH